MSRITLQKVKTWYFMTVVYIDTYLEKKELDSIYFKYTICLKVFMSLFFIRNKENFFHITYMEHDFVFEI